MNNYVTAENSSWSNSMDSTRIKTENLEHLLSQQNGPKSKHKNITRNSERKDIKLSNRCKKSFETLNRNKK